MKLEDAQKAVESFNCIKTVSQSDYEFLVRFFVANAPKVVSRETFQAARRERFPEIKCEYEHLELLNWAYDFFTKK
jgi:predicted ester cyclase